jgi:hypothetical protein
MSASAHGLRLLLFECFSLNFFSFSVGSVLQELQSHCPCSVFMYIERGVCNIRFVIKYFFPPPKPTLLSFSPPCQLVG